MVYVTPLFKYLFSCFTCNDFILPVKPGDDTLSNFKVSATDLTMEDVSKAGGYTGINRWQFVQFGDYALASNGSEKIQYFDVNSSTDFADLAAAAPVAKYITVVRDFVVGANIGAGSNPSRVNWSDINDPTDWTAGGASQSDFQELPGCCRWSTCIC